MAAITNRGTAWQIRIRHKLLQRPYFRTFDTEQEARNHAKNIEDLLDRGILVPDLYEDNTDKRGPKLSKIIDEYKQLAHPAATDIPVLDLLSESIGDTRIEQVTTKWVDAWLYRLKVEQHLSPSSVRKRVGSLARVIDYHSRKTLEAGQQAPANPLRLLPPGYSNANPTEKAALAAINKTPKSDAQRDRRLSSDEYSRIKAALKGEKRPDRERPLPIDRDFSMLFELILHTGVRLFEAYRMRVGSVDIERRFINVDGSKGKNGKIKPRTVPIVRDLLDPLYAYVKDRPADEMLFPYWDGDEETRANVTNRLSKRFATLFSYAAVQDFTEHDLRHEATCRWVLMKNREGKWAFTDAQIMKIMGWTSVTMLLRYASLRGEDLANLLDD